MSPEVSFDVLFARFQGGDEQAALEFFQRYRRVFKGYARHWLTSRPELRPLFDSDDLSQEAWRIFCEGVQNDRLQVHDEVHAQRLMAMMTEWAGRREQRRQHRRCRDTGRTQPLGTLNAVSDALEPDEAVAQQDGVEAALGVLDPQDRRIVASHYRGWKWDEIAAQEGLTSEAARSRFRRAMKQVVKHARAREAERPGDAPGEGSSNQSK